MQAATTAAASPHSSVHALAVLEAKYESLIRSNSRGTGCHPVFLLHELLSPLSPEERVLKTHVTRWADRGGY